jgi:hypothetical protein
MSSDVRTVGNSDRNESEAAHRVRFQDTKRNYYQEQKVSTGSYPHSHSRISNQGLERLLHTISELFDTYFSWKVDSIQFNSNFGAETGQKEKNCVAVTYEMISRRGCCEVNASRVIASSKVKKFEEELFLSMDSDVDLRESA